MSSHEFPDSPLNYQELARMKRGYSTSKTVPPPIHSSASSISHLPMGTYIAAGSVRPSNMYNPYMNYPVPNSYKRDAKSSSRSYPPQASYYPPTYTRMSNIRYPPPPSVNNMYYTPPANTYYDPYAAAASMGYYSQGLMYSTAIPPTQIDYYPTFVHRQPSPYPSTFMHLESSKPDRSDKSSKSKNANTNPRHAPRTSSLQQTPLQKVKEQQHVKPNNGKQYSLPPLPSIYPPPHSDKYYMHSTDYTDYKISRLASHSCSNSLENRQEKQEDEKIELVPINNPTSLDNSFQTNLSNEIENENSSHKKRKSDEIKGLELGKLEDSFDRDNNNNEVKLIDKQQVKKPRIIQEKQLEDEARLLIFLSQGPSQSPS